MSDGYSRIVISNVTNYVNVEIKRIFWFNARNTLDEVVRSELRTHRLMS
jgi:hypothetical protein